MSIILSSKHLIYNDLFTVIILQKVCVYAYVYDEQRHEQHTEEMIKSKRTLFWESHNFITY